MEARESLNGRENMARRKKKERREESLGTMTYQTSSKRSPPFCLLIGQKNTKVSWHQSEARTTATVWNWSGKSLSPGALLAVLFFLRAVFSRPFRLFLVPAICPWVSEDAVFQKGDNAIHRSNLYPLESATGFPNTYQQDTVKPRD